MGVAERPGGRVDIDHRHGISVPFRSPQGTLGRVELRPPATAFKMRLAPTSGCDELAVSFRREPRVRKHPPQVDGHLLIDVLATRWFEDLGLGSQRDPELV